MKRKKISFSKVAEGDNVTFLTFKFENEEESEESKFKRKYRKSDFQMEYEDILLAISVIGDKKALKIYFRPCASLNDNVMALPGKEDENKDIKKNRLNKEDLRVLRQYCIVLNDNIVILGNGDIKETPEYNTDPVLNEYVNILLAIDAYLKKIRFKGDVTELLKLKFEISWQ